MTLIQIVLKQMRQRALSSWLTLLSVLLAVALAIAVMIIGREGEKLLGQGDYGYDLVVGPKGSELQLVLNTTYHIGKAQATLPFSYFERFPDNLPREYAAAMNWKIPMAVGDNFQGYRIVGTLPAMFGHDEHGKPLPASQVFQYRNGRRFELAQGRVFHPRKFEAIVGAELAQKNLLQLGSKFKATHGTSVEPVAADEHDEQWDVVGILKPTHTANDRVIFIPLISFYAIPGHDLESISKVAQAEHSEDKDHHDHASTHPSTQPCNGEHGDHDHDHHAHASTAPATQAAPHAHAGGHHHDHTYELNPDGTIDLEIPQSKWRISAFFVSTGPGVGGDTLSYAVNNGQDAMAVNPAREMSAFAANYLKPATSLLLVISVLVTVVAAVSILVSIYNSVSARRKDIAILRALGATRRRVLALICTEAGLIGLTGAVAGLLLAHGATAIGAAFVRDWIGEGVGWLAIGSDELLYLGGVVGLAVIAGLVPALKAYRTPVAVNLVG